MRHFDRTFKAISLDLLLLLGYKRKYVALRGMGHHKDMLDAFETMMLRMSHSSNPEVRGEGNGPI